MKLGGGDLDDQQEMDFLLMIGELYTESRKLRNMLQQRDRENLKLKTDIAVLLTTGREPEPESETLRVIE